MDTRRALTAAGVSSTAMVLAALGGATWYYARRITEPPADLWPLEPSPEDLVRIEAVGAGTVTLTGREAARTGVWGLAWEHGYGQVGEILEVRSPPEHADDGQVVATRAFRQITGLPSADTDAALDAFAYPDDPDVLGLAWEEIEFGSPVGEIPAYLFPAEGDTWAVFVHGRSSRRHEAFRLIPTTHRLEMPSLAIAYRNDPDAPRSPDGRSHLGATEWVDLECALTEAVERGAQRFVLIGFSMGGACVLNLLRRSELADRVVGVVLEAPVLDWIPVIRQAAEERGVPGPLLPVLLPTSLALASALTGVAWDDVNHLEDPARFTTPKLLIHGTDDDVVPVALGDALANARPEIVTYLRVPGAGHVRSWNTDPSRYEAAVERFLEQVTTA
ncbi:MAG: alpha/beta hydrolase [Nitriliruptorales bacterium]|nr:alpha/beta hydrolase [Nitriliruptorales bacterium]